MWRTLRVKPKEIGVLCHEYTPGGAGEGELLGIIRAGQSRLRRSRHVVVPSAKTGCDAGRDVLIQMEADRSTNEG